MDGSRFNLSFSNDAVQDRATIRMSDRHSLYGQYMKWTVDPSSVPQPSRGRGLTPVDLSQTRSLRRLTEQPDRKMMPGTEPLKGSFSTMFLG